MAQRGERGSGGTRRLPSRAAKPRTRKGRAASGEAPQDYRHDAKRKNNLEAGLVTYERVAGGPRPEIP